MSATCTRKSASASGSALPVVSDCSSGSAAAAAAAVPLSMRAAREAEEAVEAISNSRWTG